MATRTLLIPSLLDDYFPLLRCAFASDRWSPVLLTEEKGLADLGLRYIHSDMCYPAHLVAGLEGRTRDTKKTNVTTPQRTRTLASNRLIMYFVILKLPPVGFVSL